MAKRARAPKPGEAQSRRAKFCVRLLGYGVLAVFLTAIVIGIPFPGIWQAVFVPFWATAAFVLPALTAMFFLRSMWFKAKAKHYETLLKLETDPRFK